MGDSGELRFEVERDREGDAHAPARESLWCVRGEQRARLAVELAFGAGAIDAAHVTHGFGLDVWDVGASLLARIATGWHATEDGESERTERFVHSVDGGATWLELPAADARDLEHRRTEERRVAQIDRWPASFC
ncbi:MAG: hypothetical protein M3Y87_24940 [Myxococcota bacterium]|nr:hypothetical protein [Myxococcota bacterium]